MNAQTLWLPGQVKTEILLTSNETAGAYCLLIDHPPAGWSLPAHRHRNEAETMYVVEGEFEVEVEGESTKVSAGEALHVPAGALHSGGNVGPGTARRVLVFSPGGVEQLFFELGSANPQEVRDPAKALATAGEYGWEFFESPEVAS